METERISPRYSGIDVWDPSDVLDAMIIGTIRCRRRGACCKVSAGAGGTGDGDALAQRGRLIYSGAGTSGRLAVQDGAELMPTLSWPPERLLF